MTMVDYRSQAPYEFPHRKPVPGPQISSNDRIQPLTKIIPDVDITGPNQSRSPSTYTNFARKSTQQPSTNPSSSPAYGNAYSGSRRTPSTSTTSTSHSNYMPARTPSTTSTILSRTASSRSGASTTASSYVALMRKQKATVWCDRSQHEDPRIVAQQKAAKSRATREVNGKSAEPRTSTSGSMGSSSLGVRSKIRHHGIPKASGMSYANLQGGGVPMRLSASEVGDEGTTKADSDSLRHQRHTSGRSSMGSNKWLSAAQRQSDSFSQASATEGQSPQEDIPELEETPVPGDQQRMAEGDYFAQPTRTIDSGGSGEREAGFGDVGKMNAPHTAPRKTEKEKEDELRRRGSVDERANTMGYMGGGRLFVANPDVSP